MGMAILDRAYRAATNLGAVWTNETGLPLDTVQYGGNFGTDHSVWTCPTTGMYRFTVGSILQNNTGVEVELGVGVYFAALGSADGMELSRVGVPNAGYGQFNGTITRLMTAGQTAQAIAFCSSGTGYGVTFYVGANSTIQGQWFEIQRI